MKKYYAILIPTLTLFFYCNIGIAQNNAPKEKQLVTLVSDISFLDEKTLLTRSLKECINLAHKAHRKGNFSEGIQYLQSALTHALKQKDLSNMAKICNNMGNCYEGIGDYQRALDCFTISFKIKNYLSDEVGMANVVNNMGMAHLGLQNFDKSLTCYMQSFQLKYKLNRWQNISTSLNNIGTLYHTMQEYDKAITCYQLAILSEKKLGDRAGIPVYLTNIGLSYKSKGQFLNAEKYYNDAITIAKDNHLENALAKGYCLKGSLYFAQENYADAKHYYKKSLQLYDKYDATKGQLNVLQHLGDVFLKTANYEMAIAYFEKGRSKALEIGADSEIAYADKNLQEIYALLGHKSKALFYQKEIELTQTPVQHTQSALFGQLNAQFDILFKNQQIVALNQERKINSLQLAQQKLLMYGLMSCIILISIISLLIIKQRRKDRVNFKRIEEQREEIHRKESEKLKLKIELQERKLTTEILRLNEKNEIIRKTINHLNKCKVNFGKTSLKEVNSIISELKMNSSTGLWDEFEKHFMEVHPSFYNKLKKLDIILTPNERKLCAFLKLNLSTKEISALTFQSQHSINVARTRLRKKLGLANTGTNVSSFLHSI